MNVNSEGHTNSYDLAIVLGGSIVNDRVFTEVLAECRWIVCADGGARHLARIGRTPDLLVGDMDSIDPAELTKLEASPVLIRRFSPEKDFTDSELAVEAGLETLFDYAAVHDQTKPIENDRSTQKPLRLFFWGVTGDRPDHVLANQCMAARLASEGFDVTMSDGKNWFYPLHGPSSKTFYTARYGDAFTISSIAIGGPVRGLTYEGLQYPLAHFNLGFGSQRGVSNRPSQGRDHFTISLVEGTLMLIITDPTL